jgi:hypothetical protein
MLYCFDLNIQYVGGKKSLDSSLLHGEAGRVRFTSP